MQSQLRKEKPLGVGRLLAGVVGVILGIALLMLLMSGGETNSEDESGGPILDPNCSYFTDDMATKDEGFGFTNGTSALGDDVFERK